MEKVTADQVKTAALTANVQFIPLRECSICSTTIGYSVRDSEPYFEPSCSCVRYYSPPEKRTWGELADLINMNLTNTDFVMKFCAGCGISVEA